MKKYIVSMIVLSGLASSAYAMDDFADMVGFIEQSQSNQEIQRRAEEKERRREEVTELMEERKTFVSMCWHDDYKGVKEYLESHPNVPANQYGIALKDWVRTARMAVLLEKHGIKLDQHDKNGSLLHNACYPGKTPMLLQYAIRRYCKEENTLDINKCRKRDGQTPLHSAVRGTNAGAYIDEEGPKKIKILLEAGADYAIDDKNGKTPLDILEHHLYVHRQFGHIAEITVYEKLIADAKAAMEAKK